LIAAGNFHPRHAASMAGAPQRRICGIRRAIFFHPLPQRPEILAAEKVRPAFCNLFVNLATAQPAL